MYDYSVKAEIDWDTMQLIAVDQCLIILPKLVQNNSQRINCQFFFVKGSKFYINFILDSILLEFHSLYSMRVCSSHSRCTWAKGISKTIIDTRERNHFYVSLLKIMNITSMILQFTAL